MRFVFLVLMMVCVGLGCRQNTEVVPEKVEPSVRRFGMVIGIKPEHIEAYKALHADPWPGVLAQISESNIRNYTIFLHDTLLFGYFEYVGNDYAADMALMAADSTTQAWWEITDSYQNPLPGREEGAWWITMEEVFHHQ